MASSSARHWSTAALLSLCTLVSCDQLGRADQRKEVKDLSLRLEEANTRVDQLSQRLRGVEIRALMERDRYKSAVFDPSEKGFSRLDTSVGTFAVSLQDVAP